MSRLQVEHQHHIMQGPQQREAALRARATQYPSEASGALLKLPHSLRSGTVSAVPHSFTPSPNPKRARRYRSGYCCKYASSLAGACAKHHFAVDIHILHTIGIAAVTE